MINQVSNKVIVHLAMEPATVRMKSGEEKVFRPAARGFCFVEFDDGDVHPISHPLEEWILDQLNRGSPVGPIYFKIVPPGEVSNDGQDNKPTSVNNIQTGL